MSARPNPAARPPPVPRLARRNGDAHEREQDAGDLEALGRSPDAMPTVNGITAETAEIGATIPIAPIAIPR